MLPNPLPRQYLSMRSESHEGTSAGALHAAGTADRRAIRLPGAHRPRRQDAGSQEVPPPAGRNPGSLPGDAAGRPRCTWRARAALTERATSGWSRRPLSGHHLLRCFSPHAWTTCAMPVALQPAPKLCIHCSGTVVQMHTDSDVCFSHVSGSRPDVAFEALGAHYTCIQDILLVYSVQLHHEPLRHTQDHCKRPHVPSKHTPCCICRHCCFPGPTCMSHTPATACRRSSHLHRPRQR